MKTHPWTGKLWFAGLWVVVAVILVGAYLTEPRSLIRGAFALAAVALLTAQLRAVRNARVAAG